MNKNNILAAMKADSIPAGESGLWYIKKTTLEFPYSSVYHDRLVLVPADTYTHLYCLTDSTLYNNPPGDVVMEDTKFELETHLEFVLGACGNVLISGLGLGCVIRGLLANPNVYHVTCLENSRDVLNLVEPHMPKQRLTIVEADALEWTAQNETRFDFAWHDLWTNRDNGEPRLDQWHAKLLANCRDTVAVQGAWSFDRNLKKYMARRGFNLVG